jgi:hypothetical protein
LTWIFPFSEASKGAFIIVIAHFIRIQPQKGSVQQVSKAAAWALVIPSSPNTNSAFKYAFVWLTPYLGWIWEEKNHCQWARAKELQNQVTLYNDGYLPRLRGRDTIWGYWKALLGFPWVWLASESRGEGESWNFSVLILLWLCLLL